MTGLFGPLFDSFFGTLLSYPDQSGTVKITGQLLLCNGVTYYEDISIKPIPGITDFDKKQIISKNISVSPDPITGVWSVSLYPSNYYFIFGTDKSTVTEAKIVIQDNSYDNLADYTG